MRVCTFLLMIGFSAPVWAEPVVERYENVAFNWGTMRWEFAGEAVIAESQGNEAFKTAEKQAWQHGLRTIQQAVTDLQVKQLNSPKERAVELAQEVTRSTYSRNTTYFSSGIVRVELENSLVAARAPAEVDVGAEVAGKATHSAIIIELDRPSPPAAVYRVVNEFGETLYDSKNVSSEYFRKNLMGRWFRGKSGKAFNKYAGEAPVSLSATVRDGEFLVKNSEWKDAVSGNEALLAQAKVLVILP